MTKVLVLFCGAGGSSEGVRAALPDAQIIGIDTDQDACATHNTAGFETVRADIASLPPRGSFNGLWASPPCPAFSNAGKRSGVAKLDHVVHHVMTWQPHDGLGWGGDPLIWLVTEPLRWVVSLTPEWVVCEQVPSVLPIWEATALRLRELGYWVWTGLLNAADYGVPQTRERAFLLASRAHPVQPPVPTHAEHPRLRLDGTQEMPWASMADALGWGMAGRPYFTVAPGHRDAAGLGGSYSRNALREVLMTNRGQDEEGNRQEVVVTRPAPAVSTKASGQWTRSRPATTITTKATVYGPHNGSKDESQSLKVTLEELATLQGFPRGYPFQGTKTSVAKQIGNAVPPRLAEVCVRAVEHR